MPKYNRELLKTLILNFLYIHSKRRKLGMCILFQKCQLVYPNKVNSPPIRQFPTFLIFGHVTSHVTIIKRWGTTKSQDILFGKNLFGSRSLSERYCQSFVQNTPLTKASNTLRMPSYIFWTQIERKRSLAVERKLWAIFLPRVHLEK